MAGDLMGRMAAWYDGKNWRIDPGYTWERKRLLERMDALARDGPVTVMVEIKKCAKPRTLAQNRMMWRLLQIMAREQDGGRVGGTSAEDCYIQMLEESGARVDYLCVPMRAVPNLKLGYRVVKIMELLDGNMVTVKCVEGSSHFSSQEMHDFIESIFDRLAEMGVDDAEVTGYYRDWRGSS